MQYVIEQCYINLTEVCHFFYATDAQLKEFSNSTLAQRTLKLVVECDNFAPLLNTNIFQKAADFLRELTNDNPYCHKSLLTADLHRFVAVFQVNQDNCEFYWLVVATWLNLVLEEKSLTNKEIELLAKQQVELSKLQPGTPLSQFKQYLLPKYKTVNECAQDKEVKESDEPKADDQEMDQEEQQPEDQEQSDDNDDVMKIMDAGE